ncbi:MAG: hypothetical protein U9R38_00500 [Candidatus Margulisiibacteriota bacterium]|nr:hypothetical protein [Candidatus Margulisiibacteriota bacterium]
MERSKLIALLIFLFTWSLLNAQTATGTDFPYARINLKTSPIENVYPGIGNYYAAISKGIDTFMWNPASLTSIKYAQSSLSLISELKSFDYSRKYETEDGQEAIGDSGEFSIGYFFTDDETVTTAATREHTGHAGYQTQATGMVFRQGMKVNDWLALGMISQSDVGFSLDISGAFPAVTKTQANFYNSQDIFGGPISIDGSGYITYTHTEEGGGTYEFTSTSPLWSGFLDQSSTIPLNVIVEARNDISIDPGMTLGGATKWENISFGAHFTPISATANVNNNVRAVINDGTSDVFIYQPDFDFDDEEGALNWLQDPNQYRSESGYKRNTVTVPAGEVVAEARYKGFYQASAMRSDLGINFDLYDILSLGVVMENFGGAALNFKGQGRTAYVNSRISTAEPAGFDDPNEEFNWDLFADEFTPVDGTEDLFLEEQINVELPKKLRVGLALKKPFLIALDYEQNQTPVRYQDTENNSIITVSNLTFLRIGVETQLFALPMWLRGGTSLMFKPTIDGASQEVVDNVENAFQYGVLPMGLDLGGEINLYGTHVGADFGINITSILSLYQLDALNQDLGKIGYYDIFVTNGPWQVKYLAAIDPGSTAGAYSERPANDDDFKMEYLKWIHTFTISYIF